MTLRSICRMFAMPAAAWLMLALPATASAAGSGPDAPNTSPASLGAYKAAHDTDPHTPITGSPRTLGAAPLIVSSYLIGQNQQGQSNGWYCGPASVTEALGLLGYSTDQGTMASVLKTQPYDNDSDDGTAWSGVNANVPSGWQTGYPVRDALNYYYYVAHGWNPEYYPVAVPSTPTQTDINNYEARLTGDVTGNLPLDGDAWEVAGYPQYHLTGHPDITIFHWFTIIGYQGSGVYTSYEDSATTVWSTVPAYTMSFSSSTLVVILGGRGYVW